ILAALNKPGRTEGVRKIAARFDVDPSTVQRISRPFDASAHSQQMFATILCPLYPRKRRIEPDSPLIPGFTSSKASKSPKFHTLLAGEIETVEMVSLRASRYCWRALPLRVTPTM